MEEKLPPRPDLTLDEELTRLILQRKIGTPRFKFPLSPDKAYYLLASCYEAEVMSRYRQPQFTEFTVDKIWQLTFLVSCDTPNFGALLCGHVGNGKTTLLNAFREAVNLLNDQNLFRDTDGKRIDMCVTIITTKDVIRMAKNDYCLYQALRNTPLLALDELGEEPREVRDYGDYISPVVDLIEYRYNNRMFTLFATNLAPNKIGDAYGPRIADRFREMVQIINFANEPSFRK